MEKLTIPVSAFRHTSEGYKIGDFSLPYKQASELCRYHSVPETVVNIDRKYYVDTAAQVLQSVTDKLSFHKFDQPDGTVILQPLHPKKDFATDEQLKQLEGSLKEFFPSVEIKDNKFGEKTLITQFPIVDEDSYLEDVFSRRFRVVRNPEGGINFSTQLLRLACTNGQLVADRSHSIHFKTLNNVNITPYVQQFVDLIEKFNLRDYLSQLFTRDGEPLPASVSDYLGMRNTLLRYVSEDVVETSFPMEKIKNFYLLQDIDLDKMNKNLTNSLPTGLTYYQAFCAMTHAIKQGENNEASIDISRWATPSRLQQRGKLVQFSGTPQYTEKEIKVFMGDI
jgi:hypothetical protein